MFMDTFISNSPAETEAIAAQLAPSLEPGTVLGLEGDLGAGKTQFVRGLARGLGSDERVHSPTFSLLHSYSRGRLPLFHLDLYRLETDEQIMGAGLEEYFRPEGVAVIEWMDRWKGGKPEKFYRVQFEIISEHQRKIVVQSP
jgi:tRNA threonylcarbamoyladenosine biosynthesis protein TsaE